MDLTQRYYTETLLPIRERNEETDPIFTASPAYGISSEDITYWNNKQLKLSAVQMIGSMYRTNVSGGGGISIQGNTGLFPTILEAGTYTVITDMQSNTLSYGITVSFGGNTYTLNTTNGHIYDSRLLTIPANGRWSGTVVGSVASNTKLSVKVENVVDEVTLIALVGMTNDYNDLNNKPILTNYFDGAVYDSTTKRINFTNNNIIKAYIDATAFIKDGMVDSVEISNGKLIITFNTDAGKEPIEIDITDIFDPANYYDKSSIDTLLSAKADASNLATVATSGSYNDLSNKPNFLTNLNNEISSIVSTTDDEAIIGDSSNIAIQDLQIQINAVDGNDKGRIEVASDLITIGFVNGNAFVIYPGSGNRPTYNNTDIALVTDLPSKEDKIPIVATTSTALSAEVGKYYKFTSTVNTLNITLPTISNATTLSSSMFFLTTGNSPNVTISTSETLYFTEGWSIDADTTYEINALWNGSAWVLTATKFEAQ